MSLGKFSKISEIKDTASDAAEIMRQIGNPEVQESLNKVKETAKVVNEIIQALNTTEMVKNIENFRVISENMNEASDKMKNTMNHLRESGVIDETSELIKTTKDKIDLFVNNEGDMINNQDLQSVSVASKEMFLSVKELIDEITLTVVSSKKSATIQNLADTSVEISDVKHTITS